MKVVCMTISMMRVNTYFYFDEDTKVGIVIDPGGEEERLLAFIQENGLKISKILLTHAHSDHIMAVERIREATGAPIAIHEDDVQMLKDPKLNLSKSLFRKEVSIDNDETLQDGDEIDLGNQKLKVILTPGHTRGGVCFYAKEDGVLFSGDTLFKCSIGRFDFPGGDESTLLSSIANKLFVLPDETVVYTGHSDQTTIGFEKVNNPFVKINL